MNPTYLQTNLVSDIVGLATIADPELINPFGVSHSSTSPFWVSNNGNNTTTLYAVTGSTNVTRRTSTRRSALLPSRQRQRELQVETKDQPAKSTIQTLRPSW
jgi:hypothetical protein